MADRSDADPTEETADAPATAAEQALASRLRALGADLEGRVARDRGSRRLATGAIAAPQRRGRALVAAAVVAVVAIGAGVLVVRDRGSDPARVVAGPGRPRTGDGPTGWYVPDPLPEGWTVASVRLVDPGPAVATVADADADGEAPCACETVTWVGADGRTIVATQVPGTSVDAMVARYEPGTDRREQPIARSTAVFLSPEPGADDPSRAALVLLVSDGADVLRLAGQQRDVDVLTRMAVGWRLNHAEDLADDLGRPQGFRLVGLGSTRAGQRAPFVRVSIDTGDGTVHYDLVPPGSRPFTPTAAPGALGTTGAVLERADDGAAVLSLPGADVFVGGTGDPATQAQVDKALTGSLRDAGAAGWSRLLRRVPHDPVVEEIAFAEAVHVAATGGPVASETTSDATDEQAHLRSVDGLALSIDLYEDEVVRGAPLAADLLLRNTTRRTITLNECNEGSIGIGLVPDGDTGAEVPPGVMVDCFDTPRSRIPPGATVRIAPYAGLETGRVLGPGPASRRGRLPIGRYRVAAEVPGRDRSFRVVDQRTVHVTRNPCPEAEPSFTAAYGEAGGLHSTEAGREATAAAGLRFRTLRVGEAPGPSDCDRITAYLPRDGGEPFLYTRS